MRTVLDCWKKDYRTIYELLFDTPRIPTSDIEKVCLTQDSFYSEDVSIGCCVVTTSFL